MLLETIKCAEGQVFNLKYHQARFDESRKKLFQTVTPLLLADLLSPPPKGLHRCRVCYDQNIISIEYIPYIDKIEKKVFTLKVVSSSLEYGFKYANRDAINDLLYQHPNSDDILIEKDGLLTDTSIANIAFYDGKQWFTPTKPLLKGTMRAKLLDKGFIQTRDIKKEDLDDYPQVALMNAMIGFRIINNINILTR